MKKNIKKLALKKKTVTALANSEKQAMQGGLSYTCYCSRLVCRPA